MQQGPLTASESLGVSSCIGFPARPVWFVRSIVWCGQSNPEHLADYFSSRQTDSGVILLFSQGAKVVRLTNSSVLRWCCESRITSDGFDSLDSTKKKYSTLLKLHPLPSLPASSARLNTVPMSRNVLLCYWLPLELPWKIGELHDGGLLPDIHSYTEIVLFIMTVDLHVCSARYHLIGVNYVLNQILHFMKHQYIQI